jgi:four helix bundle protein
VSILMTALVRDAMQEASETQSWLEFGLACKYIDETVYIELDNEYERIISMINSMEKNAGKFCFQ